MKKQYRSFLIVGLICIGISSACKKKNDKSRSEMLVGSWKITQSVLDSNKNLVKDANEYRTHTDSNSILFVFGADGSVKVSNVLPPTPPNEGTWKLINNDADIYRVTTTGYTFTMHIESLTDTKLIVVDDYPVLSDTIRMWTIFTKI